jgi:threonine/homoserine/homoserine lactone efflux protein
MQFIPNPLILPVGLIIGLLVAAPVGPVNVLCIHRAVERGFWSGVAAGTGAVLGDGLIAFLAALGVGALPAAIHDYRYAIQFVGGLALIAFGVKLYFTVPRLDGDNGVAEPLGKTVVRPPLRELAWDPIQTFFLTITNPGAVLGLIAIFGGVSSFVAVRTTADALMMVAAIMAGSLGWWVLLSLLIGRIRHRLKRTALQRINEGAGVLLVGFGVILIGEIAAKVLQLV